MSAHRVLFIDGDLWEPFGQLAAALSQHGVVSDHLTVAPRHWQSRYSQALERRLFARTGHHVHRSDPNGRTGAWVAPARVRQWLTPATVDVQARDDLGHLLANDPDLSVPALHHARALPPAVIYDKWAMSNLARRWGVPVPTSWLAKLGPRLLPAVLKSPVGFGGQGVIAVTDPRQWDAAVVELRDRGTGEPFGQELVGPQMVNVGGVAAAGEILLMASYRPIPPYDDPLGPPVAVELVAHEQACNSAAQLVAGSGYHGMFTIDFVLDASGHALFIDFNPRVFGAWAALQQLGFDFIGGYLHTLGIGSGPLTTPARIGADARTLGPPSTHESVTDWLRSSLHTVAAWRTFLGTRWSTAAQARLLAYAARRSLRR